MLQTISLPTQASLDVAVDAVEALMPAHRVFCLHGELGAGKTTLIKQVCRRLGVSDVLSSPSFGIVNEYRTPSGTAVFHFDLYRLKSPSELLDIGWDDYLHTPGAVLFIEWPEMAEDLLPDDAVHLTMEHGQEDARLLTINSTL